MDISLSASQPFKIPQLRILCLVLYPILIGLFGSLGSNFLSSLYILDINPLSDIGLVKIFSKSVYSHLVLLTVSFASQKLYKFIRSRFLIVDFKA